MKVAAVIHADLARSPIGTRSRLAEPIHGAPILRRTVERIRHVRRVDAVYVLCPKDQADACSALLEHTVAVVQPMEAPPAPWHNLVRVARKWSLDGWRGGIGGTCVFDEYTDCRVISALLHRAPVEIVLSLPPAAPLFDPVLADEMIERLFELDEQTRLMFAQTPPGVSGILLRATLVHELAEKSIPLGWLFAYRPQDPRKDLVFQPCCFPASAPLRRASGRLIADTDEAMKTLDALLAEHSEGTGGAALGNWLLRREAEHVPDRPREIEIELTTDDPYPDTLLHPRGDRAGTRGPMDLALVRVMAQAMSRCDDGLVVLGGFGDPLRHPDLASVLEALRPQDAAQPRVSGVALRTFGVDLSDDRIELLIRHGVDVLECVLDAWSPDLYARLHTPQGGDPNLFASDRAGALRPPPSNHTEMPGQCPDSSRYHSPASTSREPARLAHVLERLERVEEMKRSHRAAAPIVLPAFTKAAPNLHELDGFFDGWIERVGAAAVDGYCHRARALPDLSVIRMAPPARFACRRLRSRCVVLADGRVTLCDQDFRGLHAVGQLRTDPLERLWRSAELQEVRRLHERGQYDAHPLCGACDEWHRP